MALKSEEYDLKQRKASLTFLHMHNPSPILPRSEGALILKCRC